MNKNTSAWIAGAIASVLLVVWFLVALAVAKPSENEINSAKEPTVPVPSGLLAPDNLSSIENKQINGDLPISADKDDSMIDNPFTPLP